MLGIIQHTTPTLPFTTNCMYLCPGPYNKVLMIVGRIFQKVPELVQEIEEQVEEGGGGLIARKRMLVELVIEKVSPSTYIIVM